MAISCEALTRALFSSHYMHRCLQYMSDYSSCLLQGYGVLPSAPTKLKASLIASRFAVLDWKPPKVLSDTVQTYHLNTRRLGSGDEYTVMDKVNLINFHYSIDVN